ncbi:hypothetical protein [Acinetobacter sp. DSM 11652]|uniref:hypothetical protein n=1 Tax=Acinetobacter sp. DSM 11652 TaxID=346222 RepID=UPI0008B1A561|nr:hypothetical protein [Acinetobacter sp. DSM 11652]SEL87873.1 hypothetical protein SAMN05216500_10721 [Acinetobacter sp. DSM 11652]
MIQYQTRAALLQMEPSLDLNWQRLLERIFQHSDSDVREEIDRQILKPKDIFWNRVNNTFEYKVTTSLGILKHSFSSERMRSIAAKLCQSIQWLKEMTDCVQVADYLENALYQIDQIAVEDNLKLQREKMLMRRVFLQDVAKLIRELNLETPVGARQLTSAQIKSFMIEVFIKQQLLGYWFKPLLPRSSSIMEHPFFAQWLLKEQSIRHFDIVKTSEFLFVIAPTSQFEQNPFSIRRFLFEDRMEYNQQIYLNGLVLDMRRYNEEGYIKQFMEHVQMMVTIQHQVHKDVIQIVQEFEDVAEQKILPLLTQNLGMAGSNSDFVAKQHLRKIEQALTVELLQPLVVALEQHLSHIEEYEHLFKSVHRIFSDILANYKDFKQQPSLFFNSSVQLFEYKLLAYLKLLEKRKDEIFVPLNMYERGVMHERSKKPLNALQEDLSQHIQDYREMLSHTMRLKRDYAEVQGSFLKRMVAGEKLEKELQQTSLAMVKIKKQAYLDILSVPKNYRKYSVFIEFESFSATSEFERHYAFPSGQNGLTKLPVLVKLPENLEDFNLEDLNMMLSQDISASPVFS